MIGGGRDDHVVAVRDAVVSAAVDSPARLAAAEGQRERTPGESAVDVAEPDESQRRKLDGVGGGLGGCYDGGVGFSGELDGVILGGARDDGEEEKDEGESHAEFPHIFSFSFWRKEMRTDLLFFVFVVFKLALMLGLDF